MLRHALTLGLALTLAACGEPPAPLDGGADAGPPPEPIGVFDLGADTTVSGAFFDLPFPSDLRLTAEGNPDLEGYPTGSVAVVRDVRAIAGERPGFSPLSVAYFRFRAPLTPGDAAAPMAASAAGPVLLLDVDPDSPERGRLFDTVVSALPRDAYVPDHVLAVASRPGVVLRASRTYAFVVLTSYGAADGQPLEVPEALALLAAGETPAGDRGPDAAALYAPLFETLDTLGVPRAEVAAATVFTTGDEVARLRELSDAVVARDDVSFEDLAIDPSDGADHERYCELVGRISMPQFQVGEPPFNRDGRFEDGADGLPIEQRREDARVVITLPRVEMPEAGYPLMVYFHGSGGVASQVVDRGPAPPGGPPAAGEGPAHMIAEHGFASVGAALPLSPDRLPGAGAIEYLNFNNLAAFRDTFRQGVIEQRLMIEALEQLRIEPASLTGCAGPTLPAGATAFRFDVENFVGLGQSMGGMYTNLVGAVEPRLGALVPTGAGGFWSYFILETSLIANLPTLLGSVLRADGDTLTHLHPALSLLELGWEAAEPMVFMPRLSRLPLEGIPPRPIYEPVGQGDSFFPTVVYDAMALAYGHPQAGETVWPTMQDSLAADGLEGVIPYPVSENLESADGVRYTGVVVQSAGDGFSDPHSIYVQVPDVRYQWGCFLATHVQTGTAVVPAPAPLGTPCPGL